MSNGQHFLKALKMDHFAQNNTCALCNQEIKLIEGAASGHKEQYRQGGETVPDSTSAVKLSKNHELIARVS